MKKNKHYDINNSNAITLHRHDESDWTQNIVMIFMIDHSKKLHSNQSHQGTMLEWRSKAFTRAKIFRLLRQLMSTYREKKNIWTFCEFSDGK